MIGWFKGRIWPWIWLGGRLCMGAGRALATRTILLGGACSLAVFLILAAMATPVVSDAQAERSYARIPVLDETATTGLKMTVIQDAIGDRPLTRVAVADATPGSPLPPGVASLPGPGEAVVSPRLKELIETHPAVRYRFPQRVAGSVSPAGLVAPDELFAYVGVKSDELSSRSGVVVGYRDATNGGFLRALGTSELERMLTPSRVVSASLALFLVLPLSVLLAICVRFDASRRDRRLAALRLVGASMRQAHFSAAVEMSFIAAIGVITGLLLFNAISRLSEGWHVGRFYWYANDVDIPPARVAALAISIVALAVVVSAAGSRPAVADSSRVRRWGTASAPSSWRLTALLFAPAALAIAPLTLLPVNLRLLFLALGIIAAVAALTMATPLILHGAGSLASRFKGLPVWAVLAARRATHSPTITPKLVTGVLVAIYIAGFGMLIGTSIREGAVDTVLGPGEQQLPSTAEAFDVPQSVVDDLRQSGSVAGLSVSRRAIATGVQRSQRAVVVWASCQDLSQLFDRLGGCSNGTSYRIAYSQDESRPAAGLAAGTELTINSVSGGVETIQIPAVLLEVSGRDYGCQCDIVVTTSPGAGDLVVRLAGAPERFWSDAARLAPGTRFQGALDRHRGFDTDAVLTLIFVGLTLTILLGLLTFVVASLDRGFEARRRDAPLLAIGVPARTLRIAEAAQLLIVIMSGILLGVGLLALTANSWAGVFDMSLRAVVAPLLPLLGSVSGGVVLLLFAVMALTTRNRNLSAEDLRRE